MGFMDNLKETARGISRQLDGDPVSQVYDAPLGDPWNPPPKPADPLRYPANIPLRSYQVAGARWLYDGARRIIADDAGLGKTLQAAAAAVKPVLVVCPTYLVLQWEEVINTEYPDDTVSVAGVGDRKARHRALTGSDDLTTNVGEAPADWTIVNTDMLRGYMMPNVATVIFDEIHHFRNREAERSKNAAMLAERTPRVYGLSATPIYKDILDLWHQLHLLNPRGYTSFNNFVSQHAVMASDRGWGSNKVLRTRSPKALEREIAPYILRRTYQEVGLALPDVVTHDVVLSLEGVEKRLYEQVRDQFQYEDIPLTSQQQVLHTLRHVTVGTKIDAITPILEDNPGSALIFTWYQESAEVCAEALQERFKDRTVIHGGTMTADERASKAKDTLNRGGLVVATMAALSEGVDLSMSKTAIFLEEDYVPGRMYQTSRRYQRWTEDLRPINAYFLRVRGTVDTAVHRAVVSRRGDAGSILKDALD